MGAVFVLILLISAALVIFGHAEDNGENRAAATMPPITLEAFLNGELSSGAEAYINDKVMYRSSLIDLSEKIGEYKGIETPSGRVIRTETDMGTGTKQASDLLVLDNSVMEMFRKDTAASDEYAEAINSLAGELDGKTQVYSMLAPTRLEFEEPMYSNLQDSQKETIDYIYSRLSPSVKTIDAYDALSEHRDEYIYFRTDHHWTMLGAYYAYCSFCEAAGQTPIDINKFQKQSVENFTGYLLSFADGPELREQPDTIEWYDVNGRSTIDWFMLSFNSDGTEKRYRSVLYDKSKNNYDFFLGSDHPFACYINKELPEGKTIMLICDSYANCFAPWLMTDYKNVILIDPRSFKGSLSDTIDKYSPDDVLILNYVFTTSFKDYCDKLTKLYDK